MLLAGLIAQGVKVELCPLYLPNTGKNAEGSHQRRQCGKAPVVAAAMNEAGIKLFTF